MKNFSKTLILIVTLFVFSAFVEGKEKSILDNLTFYWIRENHPPMNFTIMKRGDHYQFTYVEYWPSESDSFREFKKKSDSTVSWFDKEDFEDFESEFFKALKKKNKEELPELKSEESYWQFIGNNGFVSYSTLVISPLKNTTTKKENPFYKLGLKFIEFSKYEIKDEEIY